MQIHIETSYIALVMDSNTKPSETVIVSDPDEELTSALERVRRNYGSDLASFFENIRKKAKDQPALFDADDTESTYPTAALARCAKE
ncbi:MAG: hypothetical protein HY298_13875 [Verrucomicrobia bacterium]|nr:hypothetical protein [Verrucomicrobiota bacterium]